MNSTTKTSNDSVTALTPSTALRVSVLVLYSLIFLGSLVGNSLVLYIIAKKPNTRTAFSFLFVNMSVADLIITIFVVPYSVAFYFRDYQWVEGIEGEVLCRFYTYCFTVAIAASIFTLTAMAFERFMAVVFPLRRRNGSCGHKVCTFCIWLSSTTIMIPMALMRSSQKSNDCQHDWSSLGLNNEEAQLGRQILWTIFLVGLYLIPLLFMGILYSIISHKLWHHERPGLNTEETTRHTRDQSKKIIKMLVTIVLVFSLCWFPVHAFHMIVMAFPPEKGRPPPLYVRFLCFWCGHANSAITPWMYMYLNSKFNSAFLEIIGRGRNNAECRRSPATTRRSSPRNVKRNKKLVNDKSEKWNEIVLYETEV